MASSRSCTIATPPRDLIAQRPAVPSSSPPDKTIPMTRVRRQAQPNERARRSMAGTCFRVVLATAAYSRPDRAADGDPQAPHIYGRVRSGSSDARSTRGAGWSLRESDRARSGPTVPCAARRRWKYPARCAIRGRAPQCLQTSRRRADDYDVPLGRSCPCLMANCALYQYEPVASRSLVSNRARVPTSGPSRSTA